MPNHDCHQHKNDGKKQYSHAACIATAAEEWYSITRLANTGTNSSIYSKVQKRKNIYSARAIPGRCRTLIQPQITP